MVLVKFYKHRRKFDICGTYEGKIRYLLDGDGLNGADGPIKSANSIYL